MIPPLFRRPDPSIAALYGAIVTQARNPCFYESYGVPDTVLGRFDLIVLHLALLLRRLRANQASGPKLAQALFDAFCRDMDHNLREMGISDQGVPHQMRHVGQAFYGRAHAYEAALSGQDDDALAQALIRNVHAGVAEPHVAARRLAAYVRQMANELDAQSFDDLSRGVVRLPAPAALSAAEQSR